jgi:hypothetical protein
MGIVNVTVPLRTEVIDEHERLVTGTEYVEGDGIFVKLDVRRAPWRKLLGLPGRTKVHWADVREAEIQELSALPWRLRYQLTYGDGWYVGEDGTRQYFALQPHLQGIDLARQCTVVTMRAALLAVMGGVGLRTVCWLMKMLFHVEISKSSLDRWVKECAAQLPDAAGMAQLLNEDKTITEGHFDEIFGKGQRPKKCTMVLRDEHGRIFAAEEIEERTEATVTAFLEKVKSWGIEIRVFYVDGCEAYRNAIRAVFVDAVIQYDYFHVIQTIFRKLRKAFVAHRKSVKQRSKSVETPWYSTKLEALAKKLWDNRGLIFKNPDNITPEENQRLCELIEEDRFVEKLRHFMGRVWGIFTESESELAARQRLGHLKQLPSVAENPKSAFAKAVGFLDDRFEDMIAFLAHPRVRRNSLAETGIRCLRRLERGHDGFRGAEGLDCYLRIYQAVKYCDWTVHGNTSGLGICSATGPPSVQATPVAM